MHAETLPRLDRLIGSRTNQPAYDWKVWLQQLAELPPGMPRLERIANLPSQDEEVLDDDSLRAAWMTDALESCAEDGAILVEVRFGWRHLLRPSFMTLFRQAERRARERHPEFRAEAIVCVWPTLPGSAEVLDACLDARAEGLAGMGFIPKPYDSEADWTEAYRWADRASEVGLGITAHAGEFSSANLRAAMRAPGLSRIGHGVYAAYEPDLLEQIAGAGVTVECCLTSNVVLGATQSLETHPIKAFVEAGVPVTLNTDNPVRMRTSIGREYEQAASLARIHRGRAFG